VMQCCLVFTLFGCPLFISVSVPRVGWYLTTAVPVLTPAAPTAVAWGWAKAEAVPLPKTLVVVGAVVPKDPNPVVLVAAAGWPNKEPVGWAAAVCPKAVIVGLAAPKAGSVD